MAPDPTPNDLAAENRLTGAYLIVALIALFGGVLTGLLQALEHAGLNLYPWFAPVIRSYYHGLSLHGVLNVLVYTTFFICGFLQFVTSRALGMPLASRPLAWATFWLMTGGLILAAIPLVANAATVLFTFYPPLRAHWAFYLGLTLVVVGDLAGHPQPGAHAPRLAGAVPRDPNAASGLHGDGHLRSEGWRSFPTRCTGSG